VLDIPGVSFEVFGISLGHPKTRKDIPKSENLEWDIPKLMNDRCRVSFFVLGYLSLSHSILVLNLPIHFSVMQLVARKPAWLSQMIATFRYPPYTRRSPSTCIFTGAFKFSCPSHAPPVYAKRLGRALQGPGSRPRRPSAPPAQRGVGGGALPSASWWLPR
jgi:hypothetical protein